MKLLSMSVSNFGSYANLDYNFLNQGLCLVYGPTGSGKSTIMDASSWIILGSTAKNSTADSIKSWNAGGSPTIGTLEIETEAGNVYITRIRGSQKENDLYWEEGDHTLIRGKDMAETQEMLNARLGINPYLYALGAYYNEFSPTGQFFTAKAGDRRAMFESMIDLSFPVSLSEAVSISKKSTNSLIGKIAPELEQNKGKLSQLVRSLFLSNKEHHEWEIHRDKAIDDIKADNRDFEKNKETDIQDALIMSKVFEREKEIEITRIETNISAILEILRENTDVCITCGQPNESHAEALVYLGELRVELSKVKSKPNTDELSLPYLRDKTNPNKDYTILANECNPHAKLIAKYKKDIENIEIGISSQQTSIQNLNDEIEKLETLESLLSILRSELAETTIKKVEQDTNELLEKFFDSELRVLFEVQSSDKLNVIIHKSGNEAIFKQLSKGQRSLLKLCFAVSAMTAVSNKSGVHFDTLMLDEACDGLDEDLKLKAFNLFSELSKTHDTVIVIDHSVGLQNLFDRKFQVSMAGDISSIQEDL